MYMIHFAWPIKHVAVKPTLEIQLTHVIVKCKEPVFVVLIVLVDVVSARKLYQDFNKFHSFFLFISKSLKFFIWKIIPLLPHIPTISLVLFETCQPVFHLTHLHNFYALEQQSYHPVWTQLRKSVFLGIHTYLINRTLSSIFAYLEHLTNFDGY